MSIEQVGPRIEVPFPVVTNAGFPHGLRCVECHRLIVEGQPYVERLQGVYDNGDTMSLLTCAYCPEETTR